MQSQYSCSEEGNNIARMANELWRHGISNGVVMQRVASRGRSTGRPRQREKFPDASRISAERD